MTTMTRWSLSLALVLSVGVGMAQAQEVGTLVGFGAYGHGQINVPTGNFKAIAAGGYHSIAIREDGTLVGWGDNTDGQINVPAGAFKAVATSDYYYSLGIREDGTLVGWGNNDYGQINVPTGTFKAIDAGLLHSIGIREDGTIAGWGFGIGFGPIPTGTFTAIDAGGYHSLAIREVVLNVNDPPVCSLGQPTPASLWPPTHTLASVGIVGVADPDNDQITITVTGVTQDEPVNGLGDGDTSPDAVLQGSTALLRAERSGTGNGRVYQLTFTAGDNQGGSCIGRVKVQVPHSRRGTAVEDGQLYDSTLP